MAKIKIAIAGMGNCASALIQGLYFYRNIDNCDDTPGVMHPNFAGYSIGDIQIVAAFDVSTFKIGRDVSDAIFQPPNVCIKYADVPKVGVNVQPAPILDGVAEHMREHFNVYDTRHVQPVDVVQVLKETHADMLLNYIPVGSAEATQYYAQACLDAGCAFVNCIPEFIASSPVWAERFTKMGLPVAGDDIKSQVGATIVHRVLSKLLVDRGVKISETYQLNIGGNTDFLNMTVEERLASKRISKTEAVKKLLPYDIPTRIGPSDYVHFLGDTKICYIYIKGRKFGDTPIKLHVKLEVEDSPNSAGVVVDLIRAVKIALDRKIAGPLISIAAYSFKHPPVQVSDDVARQWVEEFIRGERER